MSNTYTQFFTSVPCTLEQGRWLERVLDHVRSLRDLEETKTEVTKEEAEMLDAPHLHEDFLEMAKGVTETLQSCDYRIGETVEGSYSIILYSEESGSPDFVLHALSLLTGKFPEAYPEPLVLEWSHSGDRGGGSGGQAQVYKGYIDTPEFDPEFKEGIEAVLAAYRLAAREEKLSRAAPQAHMKLQTKLNELLAQHSEMIFNHILGLPVVDQLEMLIAQGGYTEQQLQDLLFPPTSKPN